MRRPPSAPSAPRAPLAALLGLLLALAPAPARADDPPAAPAAPPARAPENLVLRARGGRVVSVSSENGNAWPADRLLDGAVTDQGYSTADRSRLPQDIVLAFPRDQIAVVERIVLNPASRSWEDCRAKDVEVLASLASPIDDFVSLGRFVLANEPRPQSFDLPRAQVKFLKVRLLSNHGGKSTTLNEIEVWGVLPETPEFFVSRQDPAKLDKFKKLRADSVAKVLRTPLEDRLAADAADGKLDQLSLAEAAFIAAGVPDDAALAKYLAAYRALVARARAALPLAGKKDAEKGRLIFAWLHKEFFTRYRAHWTELTGVFDTREFNCVSSATLYDAVGQEFKLDLRAIEVPDHAFSLLYADGEVIDVETTTPAGFNPLRDKNAIKQFEKETGYVYIEDRHSLQRREVGNVGLVSIVYYNRGVGFLLEKKFADAIAANVKALDLDPGNASALRNLVVGYERWGVAELQARRFEFALSILREGRRIDPFNPALCGNTTYAWQEWALDRAKAKDWPGAVAAVGRAREDEPDNVYYSALGRDLYERWAAELARAGDEAGIDRVLAEGAAKLGQPGFAAEGKAVAFGVLGLEALAAKDYEKALSWLDRARALLPAEPRLRSNWQAVYYEWAKAHWEAGRPREAIALYTKGLKAEPAARLFRQNRAYILQEWMRALAAAGKDDELEQSLDEAVALDPTDAEFQEARVATYLNWGYEESKKGRHRHAIEIYDRGEEVAVKDPILLRQNRAASYAAWALELVGQGKAAAAEAMLVQAAAAHPKDDRLSGARDGFFINQAQALVKAQGFAEAAALLARGLKLANTGAMVNARAWAYQEWARTLTAAGQADQAEAELTAAARANPNDANLRRTWETWVVNRGAELMKGEDFEGAVGLCARARAVDARNTAIGRNRKAAYLAWARALDGKGDRAGAVAVLDRALVDDPKDRDYAAARAALAK
ncbi:MAG: hypothetical protein HZA54_11605 [Planctomycetes bacterium]|nr:hypothetical protein [Planctomycetota bacterium]